MNDIKTIINQNYNLQIINIEKSEESTDGNVYILKLTNSKYIAKIYDSLDHVKSMIELHNYLYNNGMYVSKIINDVNNNGYIEINNKYIVIYSFLEGIQIREQYKIVPDNIIKAIAVELRKLHNITPTNNFNLKKIPFQMSKDTLRSSVLHFDLTRSNIFSKDDKIGFIDFDDAKYGPSICDVAIIISIFFFSKKRGVDIESMKAFIDAYYGNDSMLKDKEVKYIKEYALAWIDHIMDGNHFDTSTVESFNVKRELIERNM